MSNNQEVESSAPSPPIRELFFAARVETVIRQSRSGVLILLVISVFGGLWILWETSLQTVIVWIICMVIVCLAAYLKLTEMLQDPEKELKARRWANIMALGSLLIGAGWGALSILYFPHENASLLSFLILATVALTALASSVLSAVVSIFWAFLLAAVLPLCIQIIILPGYSYIQSGLILSCFLIIIGLIARQNENKERFSVREKVILRKEVQSRRLIQKAFLGQKERADTATTVRREFMSHVSLQLRTHLTSIIGFSGVLMRNAREEHSPQNLSRAEKVNRNGRQLLLIIDNVLGFSRIETNQVELEEAKLNLHNLIEESVELQRENTNEKGLNLSYSVADNVPEHVIADSTRLWQILNNLIGNAIKFTQKGGIDIKVESGGLIDGRTRLRFNVKDTGIGIEEKIRAKLFLPFSQRGSDERGGGMGLGLAVSKHLVELMGGDIAVWSQPGEGSVFSFMIQCGEVAQTADTASGDLA